jgi:hypothetical protein
MKKSNIIIAIALIEGFAAANTVVANSDDVNVLEILADMPVIRSAPVEVNAPPLLEISKQIRFSATQTRIAALPDDYISKEKNALSKILVRFNEMKIPHARQKAAEQAPAEPNTSESQLQETETFTPGHIDAKTLEELVASAKDPNSIAEPLSLAQTLYRAGYPGQAAVFYEIAVGRTTAMGRILSSDDKSWILLQLAACYTDSPQTAISILDKLISDYPKSFWASAAVTKRDILQWYLKDNPRQLLESRNNE